MESHSKSNKDIDLSKSLSWILRHGAQKEGIPIGPDGYVRVSDLLTHHKFKKVSLERI